MVFTLVIIAAVIVIVVWFFKKKRHNIHAAVQQMNEDVPNLYVNHDSTSMASSHSANSLFVDSSVEETDFVAEKYENDQIEIPEIDSPSFQDVIVPISNTVEQDIGEETIEFKPIINVEEKEKNISEMNKHDVLQSPFQDFISDSSSAAIKVTVDEPIQNDTINDAMQSKTEENNYPEVDVIPNLQKKRDPEKRAGARRGKRENDSNETEEISDKAIRTSKPEIVCWQQSRKWFVGVEISDKKLYGDNPSVKQVGIDLNKVSAKWVLSNIKNNVEISSQSTSKIEIPVAEEKDSFLIFKLSGQNLSQGRRVRYATTGTFLVVVPGVWGRNEELSDTHQIPPDPCHLERFQAHYFYLNSESDERIVFITPDNNQVEIPRLRSQFEITGSLIKDDNEIMGPLFGKSCPKISCREKTVWQNISVIVLGEEGGQGRGWRISFEPNKESLDQNLNSYLNDRLGGWYFVRMYNSSENLVESLDFRFALALENIGVDHHDVLPGNLGHKPINITFFHFNNTLDKLECQSNSELIPILKGKESTVEIPAKQSEDKTNWILWFNQDSNIEISLLVERIWWRVCMQETNSQNILWSDKPVVLYPLHLAATSKHLIRIRLPKCRWTKEVQIGFEKRKARIYRVEVTKQEVDIPLNHLGDVIELEDTSKDHSLNLWINGLPYQTIAIITNRRKNAKLIKYNRRRTFKYLTRLHRTAKDIAFSELVNQYKKGWSWTNSKKQSDAYFLQIACVIKVGYEVLHQQGNTKIGDDIRWLRSFTNIAESNRDCFSDVKMKYETLNRKVKDSK